MEKLEKLGEVARMKSLFRCGVFFRDLSRRRQVAGKLSALCEDFTMTRNCPKR